MGEFVDDLKVTTIFYCLSHIADYIRLLGIATYFTMLINVGWVSVAHCFNE